MELIPDCTTACNTDSVEERDLRGRLALIRARYDHGAISPAVFSVIRMLEVEIAWRQHHGEAKP